MPTPYKAWAAARLVDGPLGRYRHPAHLWGATALLALEAPQAKCLLPQRPQTSRQSSPSARQATGGARQPSTHPIQMPCAWPCDGGCPSGPPPSKECAREKAVMRQAPPTTPLVRVRCTAAATTYANARRECAAGPLHPLATPGSTPCCQPARCDLQPMDQAPMWQQTQRHHESTGKACPHDPRAIRSPT